MERKSNLYAMDFIDSDHLEAMQLERMKKIVRHAYNNVEFYRNRMKKYNLTPDSVKTLDDVEKLPFMVKQDLRDTYPFGLFAVPQRDIPSDCWQFPSPKWCGFTLQAEPPANRSSSPIPRTT